MEEKVISPWADQAEQESPNGRIKCIYINGYEIAKDAPTKGELWLYFDDNRKELISMNAAASFIWAEDSECIVYSEWTQYETQIIRILRINGMVDKIINEEMNIIQFISFWGKMVEGIDSPKFHPRKFKLNIEEY